MCMWGVSVHTCVCVRACVRVRVQGPHKADRGEFDVWELLPSCSFLSRSRNQQEEAPPAKGPKAGTGLGWATGWALPRGAQPYNPCLSRPAIAWGVGARTAGTQRGKKATSPSELPELREVCLNHQAAPAPFPGSQSSLRIKEDRTTHRLNAGQPVITPLFLE